MINNLSILYIGSLDQRSNSFRRYKSLLKLHPHSDAIDTDPFILNKYIISVQHHFNWGPGIYLLNKKIIHKIIKKKFDIILVDNKPYFKAKTIQRIKQLQPQIKIANLLTDDPFGHFSKSWRVFKKTASLYDIIFVQREVNIRELENMGVKKVALCYRSYDPEFNRPIKLSSDEIQKYGTTIGFVGSYEKHRASYIAYLIQNGIPVTVTGAGWVNQPFWDIIKPTYKAPFVYGDEYIKTLCGMDIALHFLRHANRDEQDSRTFEITASGVFMLAEKSSVHESLFVADKEAVFFETKEELLEKVKYYIFHKSERETIARAGLQKCISGKYSHAERLQWAIKNILEE